MIYHFLLQFQAMSFRRIQRFSEPTRTPSNSSHHHTFSPDANIQPFHFAQQRYAPPLNDQLPNTAIISKKAKTLKLSQSKRNQVKLSSTGKQKRFANRNIMRAKASPSRAKGEDFEDEPTEDLQEWLDKERQTIQCMRDYQQLNQHPQAKYFRKMLTVGRGGFGRAWKVMEVQSRRVFVMKVMRKAKIVDQNSVFSVMNERELLAQLSHPFLVNMKYAFQDRECLYLVVDYCSRGDLRFHLSMVGSFKEPETRFFLACLLLCLQYLHSMEIIHRDLKPENLVLDEKGYVRVTDLGISRPLVAHNGRDTSGTPSYMAPEVLLRKNHSYCVDFYALGVIAFQFMTGRRPYLGSNRQQIRQKILSTQVQLTSVPEGWSSDSVDFINRLIQRRPEDRLGFKGIAEVKAHPFFKAINWQLLYHKKLPAPFLPKTIEEDYQNYQRNIPEVTQVQGGEREVNLDDSKVKQAFKGYEYDGNWRMVQRGGMRRSSLSRHWESK